MHNQHSWILLPGCLWRSQFCQIGPARPAGQCCSRQGFLAHLQGEATPWSSSHPLYTLLPRSNCSNYTRTASLLLTLVVGMTIARAEQQSTMLTHGMVSLLLHIVGAWSIPMPYDIPSAENHIPTNACDLPLSLIPPGSSSSLFPSPHHGRDNFTQLIHHADPELGLFSQAFLWNNTFWRPGAPIVLFLAGETSIDHYGIFSHPEFSTVGVIAQHLGAATIVLEHRYFGSSLPFRNFTKAHLQYLTVDNALKDVVRFAENFVAPWTDRSTTAQDVPWILIGMLPWRDGETFGCCGLVLLKSPN